MKKLTVALIALLGFLGVSAQDSGVQPATFGISIIYNDFTSAANVRKNNLGSVFKNKEFSKLKDMTPGLAVSYTKGINKSLDYSLTLSGSLVDYPVPNKVTYGNDGLLLEGDATIRGRMLPANYLIVPYLQTGVGVSNYRSYVGAYIPVGTGMQINVFDEAYLNIQAQYRIPATEVVAYHFWFGIGFSAKLTK
ncbi:MULTISPECIES: hypothetical protein [unclassified Paraflavitalea]|uniref:hypothetical protein n=1 Tax=unclassified Paraflavitalea TaxID=2798305 RepID=UPI003D340903